MPERIVRSVDRLRGNSLPPVHVLPIPGATVRDDLLPVHGLC